MVDMRELIYLSEAKLRQFRRGRSRLQGRGRALEGEVKTPLGGFKIGRAADGDAWTALDLDTTIAELDRSPRAPKWFTEDDLQPGQWIHFEMPMVYDLVARAVVFVDGRLATLNERTEVGLRLVLHGSPDHLVGGKELFGKRGHEDSQTSVFPGLAAALYDYFDGDQAGADDWRRPRSTAHSKREQLGEFRRYVDQLRRDFGVVHRAAWMAGYARVTAVFESSSTNLTKILVATPLYVEYVHPPDESELGI